MKVFFKYGFSAYSGMVDQMVYQSWFNNVLCLSRKFTYPTLTENNTLMGKNLVNLGAVYEAVSPAYLQDLTEYADRNLKQNKPRNVCNYHPMPGSMALFVKMMYAWQESDPTHVDLSTVTIADIIALDADVRTVARAIEAKFLRKVRPYADLTSDIQ